MDDQAFKTAAMRDMTSHSARYSLQQPTEEDEDADSILPGQLEKSKKAKRKPRTAAQVATDAKIAQYTGTFQFAAPDPNAAEKMRQSTKAMEFAGKLVL